jgi:hypothetical protein
VAADNTRSVEKPHLAEPIPDRPPDAVFLLFPGRHSHKEAVSCVACLQYAASCY